MQDSAVVAIARLACGTAILISGAVFKVDGTLTAISLFLLGVPVEFIQTIKKTGETKE